MIDWKARLKSMPDKTEAQRAERRLVLEFIEDQGDRENEIVRAFDDLRTARVELYEVSEADLMAREALKVRESDLLLSGAIIGKNAETRAAELKNGCKEELAEVERMRALKEHVRLRAELASLRVQELQWLIRNDQGQSFSVEERPA